MSMTPEQLQMMQQLQTLQMKDAPQQQMEQGGQQLPPELMVQMQQLEQNPNTLGIPQEQPEPLDALKEVAFLACDVFTEFVNDKKLDVQTKAGALSQMSQVIGNIFGHLNQPDPQQDLEFKVAEFQMKAQEKQMDMEMKKEEFELKKVESQLKLESQQLEARLKAQELTMNIQNKQTENSLNLEQKKRENEMNIDHKKKEHQTKLQQQKQAPQSKPVKKPSN